MTELEEAMDAVFNSILQIQDPQAQLRAISRYIGRLEAYITRAMPHLPEAQRVDIRAGINASRVGMD